jgi:signal transduction histidine kinase
MLKRLKPMSISSDELDQVVDRYRSVADMIDAELRAKMDAVVAEYRESKSYQQEVVELLRPDLEKTLGQVHDYKQFVQQIIQNLNVLLEEQFPGLPIEEKLEQATHQETAMYWAALIMDERLDAALFLESPERIHEPREQGQHRLHGVVLKYLRIYQSRANDRQLKTAVIGESWGNVAGNTRALGIIPHTLIDNAIKYAPEGSRVTISLDEQDDAIVLAVESLGPKIGRDERSRIFDLFYRGEQAREKYSEGTGFGLASAQNVAKAHDTEITVEQDDNPGRGGAYRTEFRVSFDRAPPAAPSRRPKR